MPTRGRGPKQGDVVVSRDPQAPEAFRISEYPRPAQLRCAAPHHADTLARAFASRADVDAWFTLDGRTYEAIARHRDAVTARDSRTEVDNVKRRAG